MTVHRGRARRTTSALPLLLTATAIATAACGGAEPAPAKAPAQETRDSAPADEVVAEPRTIEEAQERIARAQAMLDADSDDRRTLEASPRAPSSSPQGGTAPSARHEREDACGSPCRALASMKRAVEALCRMTGDTDDRCVEARRTLGESTSRVASCKCEVRG